MWPCTLQPNLAQPIRCCVQLYISLYFIFKKGEKNQFELCGSSWSWRRWTTNAHNKRRRRQWKISHRWLIHGVEITNRQIILTSGKCARGRHSQQTWGRCKIFTMTKASHFTDTEELWAMWHCIFYVSCSHKLQIIHRCIHTRNNNICKWKFLNFSLDTTDDRRRATHDNV